jgi:hypothetical protein
LPIISIPQLENSFISSHEYTGVYSQENTVENRKIVIARD